MAKLFKVKNKGLGYAICITTLSVLVVVGVGTAITICFGIGYGLKILEIGWANDFLLVPDDASGARMTYAGYGVLLYSCALAFVAYFFCRGVKALYKSRWFSSWFNSIGDLKGTKE